MLVNWSVFGNTMVIHMCLDQDLPDGSQMIQPTRYTYFLRLLQADDFLTLDDIVPINN